MMQRRKWTRGLTTLLLLLTSLFGVAIPAKAALTGTTQALPLTQTVSPTILSPTIRRGQTIANLNVRSGPGVNFARLAILPRTATVALLGRNQAGNWLYVTLESDTGPVLTSVRGWVSAAFIQTAAEMMRLPIIDGTHIAPATPSIATPPIATPIIVTPPTQIPPTQIPPTQTPAARIPTSTPMPTPSPTVAMSVTVNPTQVKADTPVHVLITSGPRDVVMQASLRQPSGTQAIMVGSTKTDGKGLAALDFTMPGEWPDHRPITEHQLQLVITSPTQSITQIVPLQYQVQ